MPLIVRNLNHEVWSSHKENCSKKSNHMEYLYQHTWTTFLSHYHEPGCEKLVLDSSISHGVADMLLSERGLFLVLKKYLSFIGAPATLVQQV